MFCIAAEMNGCIEGRVKGDFLLVCATLLNGDFLLEYDDVLLRLPPLGLSWTENCVAIATWI
jgi:hypothetical protein